MIQHLIEDGTTRTLQEFTSTAVAHLKATPWDQEVVQLADHITELAKDSMTRPEIKWPLPKGYAYRFSGFWGQVIGVVKNDRV